MKRYYIISGGLMNYIAPHLALCAPAYGSVGRLLMNHLCDMLPLGNECHLIESKMASQDLVESSKMYTDVFKRMDLPLPSETNYLETNSDFSSLLEALISDPETKCIFLPVAVCDFYPTHMQLDADKSLLIFNKYARRIHSRDINPNKKVSLEMTVTPKFLHKIRKFRKDVFVVAFSHTSGATPEEQYNKALRMVKEGSINLVLANDISTKNNMVVAPEETVYHETIDRYLATYNLVSMALSRSSNHFTRSEVLDGPRYSFKDVPETLREVLSYCISRGAYKPVLGATAGHFAFRLSKDRIVTSIRKSNFNEILSTGMVVVEYQGLDKVIAYGAKPSVGGQSQRIIFDKYPNYNCIVHFHCPPKADRSKNISVAPQQFNECGSHECGRNTADNLKEIYPGIAMVYLDNHGPNIVFDCSRVSSQEVINVIEENFDLSKKTGGYIPSI